MGAAMLSGVEGKCVGIVLGRRGEGGAHGEAGRGEAQVEDEVQDLVIERAVQAHQRDTCSAVLVLSRPSGFLQGAG